MRPRPLLAALLASLALGAAACGGDDDDDGGNGGGAERSPQQVVDAGDQTRGEEVYAQNCAACHGQDGGGGSGPRLAGQQAYTNADVVVEQVRNGGGGMPAFADRLSDQELSDVSAYVTKVLAAE
jgi:mono/diheme cytochrome c family protein